MIFSRFYTNYTVIPRVVQPGRPQEVDLNLVITTSLLTDWNHAGQNAADRVLTQALNFFAGGRRMFRHTPVTVTWKLNWYHPGHHHLKALGVSFIPKAVLAGAGEGGLFAVDTKARTSIANVYLAAEDMDSAMKKPKGLPADLFRRTAAHEFGHAETLTDDRDDQKTIMYFRQFTPHQLRRIKQRWTDEELRGALQKLFDPINLPAWLHS